MCGIAGIFNYANGAPADSAVLQSMVDSLAHRGPDDSGIHVDGSVGLGHRRLSIIDTSSAGHQPMSNDDASITIAYNGECYNFQKHIPLLEAKGHRFRSSTDTEVVLRLYEEYGPACVEMLGGMFAFAIWDAKKQRLSLYRDRLGIKPLYVYDDGQRLFFASEMKSFLSIPNFPKDLNLIALRNYLRFMCVPEAVAIFDNVAKVQPGHIMIVDKSGCTSSQYWDINNFSSKKTLSIDAAAEEFSELFKTIIQEQMVSDVPLGTFLSGGVDSSAITAQAALATDNPLKTFSVAFTGHAEFDESDYAIQVADRYATCHNYLEYSPDLINTLPAIAWHADEPFAISSSFALYHLAEMASKQVKVVLSGDGADEVFAGYEHRYTPLPWRLPRQLSPLAHILPGRLGRSLRWRTTPSSHDFCSRINRFKPHQAANLLLPDVKAKMHNQFSDLMTPQFETPRKASQLSRMLYADIKTTLTAEMLTKVDRMTMAHGLEARVPFLDHRLVEWAFTLPDSLRIQDNTGKRVVKRAMEPLLPHGLLYRPKHGFNVPFAFWIRNELREWITDILSPAAICKQGIFNPAYVNKLLRDHMSETADNSNRLIMLVMFELWRDKFMD